MDVATAVSHAIRTDRPQRSTIALLYIVMHWSSISLEAIGQRRVLIAASWCQVVLCARAAALPTLSTESFIQA